MKHDWEYKKLNEVCKKDSSNIQQNKIVGLSGDYPVYGASGYVQNIDFYHQENPYIGIVKDGSGVGRVNTYPAKTSLLGTMQYIIPNKDVSLGYLAYCLKSMGLSKFASGAAIPHIYFRDYGECSIPVPGREEQEKIVAELDKVSEIIEKKKQQVKELDNLAQSIFYDMFGDPVENEKGWEVCKWRDCLDIYNGKNQKQVEDAQGAYPICGSGGVMGYARKYITPEHSVIVGRKGNINKPIYMSEKFWNVDTAFGIHPRHNLNARYLFYYCVVFDFERLNKAVTIPSLTKSDLLEIGMPLPPIELQEEFAKKIEAIEREKGLIGESIKESERLFDARMDYWFGE